VKVVTIVGNRPQFVKAAAVSRRLRERHEEVLVNSGQHYDAELSRVFFEELDLPAPDHELGVGSGTHAQQVSGVMSALHVLLQELQPQLGLVYGDTNTTLGGALALARRGIPVAHVESGMRSFDHGMAEERNRVLTDHVAELLLCSTPKAAENLAAERIREGAHIVGDVMADVTLMMLPVAERRSRLLEEHGLEAGRYLLVTSHRAENVDSDESLGRLVELIAALPLPVVFPVHPRTRERLRATGALGALERSDGVALVAPLGYLDFLQALRNAKAVLTDSGGVQKEAYLVRTPCLTLRETTEWVETVELGWNVLVGLDPSRALDALARLDPPDRHPELYGGGRAGERVVAAIDDWAAGAL
jgi:UDP-N-acetylglucosamine 2-epimerase (non-hydrolysing)/UDP-GlcNAc3NAcA epimerase